MKYAQLKNLLVLYEWELDYETDHDLYLIAELADGESDMIAGWGLDEGEQTFWVRRDIETKEIVFLFPPSFMVRYDNIFGGSFRVVQLEGSITETGPLRLLESYDGDSAIYLTIEPR